MRKNVLIISSSPRKGGNSETLAASFAKGHCVIKDDCAGVCHPDLLLQRQRPV